jgi:hypothetical protein
MSPVCNEGMRVSNFLDERNVLCIVALRMQLHHPWSCCTLDSAERNAMRLQLVSILIVSGLALASARPFAAETLLRDPKLPSVPPKALRQLSDNRVRQAIIRESQARYPGRCVCRYQTQDSNRRSCNRRHEVIKTTPIPLCYPAQVSEAMVRDWRRRHP